MLVLDPLLLLQPPIAITSVKSAIIPIDLCTCPPLSRILATEENPKMPVKLPAKGRKQRQSGTRTTVLRSRLYCADSGGLVILGFVKPYIEVNSGRSWVSVAKRLATF